MQTILKAKKQIDLVIDIAKWQDEQIYGDHSIFIEAIMFIPYFNGYVTAIINYRPAEFDGSLPITVEVQTNYYSGPTTEQAVFSAMAGGTDGG